MAKNISHIRTSILLGSSVQNHDVEDGPLAYDEIWDAYFDQEGCLTSEKSGAETTQYTYGPNGELLRKTTQCSEINEAGVSIDHYKQWDYEYDDDLNVMHISYTDTICSPIYWPLLERGGIPSNSSSDEWYDWSLDGKTCTVHISVTEERRTSQSFRVELYNDDGSLFEENWYNRDHVRTSKKTYFYWEDGNKQRTVYSYKTEPRNILDEPKRIVETNDYDEKGRWIARYTNGELEMRIEYDEDEEGNGIEARFFNPDETLFALMKREIDYWEDLD